MNDDNWITVTCSSKRKDMPSKIEIRKNGTVFIDGELYNEKNSKYENLSVSIEKYNKMNTGQETQEMIKSRKKFKKGDTAVIKDINAPNKSEKTVVKF